MPVSVLELNIAPTVSWTTSLRSILAEPSKDTPCIVLAVSKVVAVVAFPAISPTKEVAAKILLETNLPSLLFQVIVGLLEDPPNSIPAPLVYLF